MTTGYLEKRPSQLAAFGGATLGSARCRHLAGAIAGLVPDWWVELHYDEHGKAAIVIMPENPDDPMAPTLVVSATDTAYQIDELRGDTSRSLGINLCWDEVLRTVRIRLTWEGALPATLH